MHTLRRFLFAALLCLIPAVATNAQQAAPSTDENFVRSHYTKYEFRIPMRDGVRLFTAVYVPKTTAFASEAGPFPFLMSRTPYSVEPYGVDKYPTRLGPSDEFEKSGYIFVNQDVRGRWMSEGEFVEMRPHIDVKKSTKDVDDASDMYDTIEFLLKHVENNNGKVGIWGISYPGFYTSASIIDSHPALVAASPQAPMTDLFRGDDSYHNGAFKLSATYGFYAPFFHQQKTPINKENDPEFDFGTPDSYRFYLEAGNLDNLTKKLNTPAKLWEDQIHHNTYDSYWQPRDLERHMNNVHCAVLVVGGWFDAEDLAGPLYTYNAIRKFNPATPATLVEGPWVHGGWMRSEGSHLGDVQFDAKTAEYFRSQVQYPFFEHYLKGKGAKQPAAVVFETGTNVWHNLEAWPPRAAAAKTLYFHANGKLSFDAPTEANSKDEYLSDPAHPVPFVAYTTDTVPQRYMVDDQRFASERPDVVTYQTGPLEEDVTIAGPIAPHLKIASSATDSDFVVKLIDVYPDDYPDAPDTAHGNKRVLDAPPLHMGGYQQLLRGEPFRAKFRNSWEKPEPLTPGQQTAINFSMPDLYHTFRRGHRIMVQVQSSWFPLVDRNPQTFTDIPSAKPEDFKKASEQIFHQKDAASGVEVLVVPQR
ncbi:CocE/NonD family hydrolase [Telmatobacter bradus]|uniref:CocE/NonD family hydrolase n=1 Tax=Telmatobacter bradus TaxID=474953 RepID=UPI003B43CC70